MPSTSSRADDAGARIARLERLADKLDSRFSLFGLRFGWDSILGLVPGLGDAVTAIPGAIMIYEGHRLGASMPTLVRMAANTGIDFVIGGIPVLGDAFDVAFKSHRRNIALLRRDLDFIETAEKEVSHG